MEDPWVNAWGDPPKPSSEISAKPPLTSTWSSSNFVTDDQADIAVPSWESESGAVWDDSPDLHKGLWSSDNRASQLWTAPTFDSIGFAKPSQESVSPRRSESPSSGPQSAELESLDQEVRHDQDVSVHDVDIHPPSTSDSEPEPVPPIVAQGNDYGSKDLDDVVRDDNQESSGEIPADVDGFGTFEDAVETHSQSGPWTHQTLPQIESGDWGETWKGTDVAASNGDAEPLDEWELAKRQKEIQDRYVPPEFLGSILSRFDEFASDYWPEELSGDSAYQHSQDELADMLGISSIVDRLVPADLTLPPTINFMKTFISKEMIDALKLTRHHAVTLNSPLAVYMNSKGSLSWEASVKSRLHIAEADVVPSGWRIVSQENVEPQQSTSDTKRKVGGLLSFFGRKTTPTATSSGSSSPIRATTPMVVSPRTSTTSRPSTDVNISTPIVPKAAVSLSREETEVFPSATMSALAEISSISKTDTSVLSSETEEPVQASAVSRFFGRFSRSNRSPASNSRNSVALSTDDLEFLSDIVPSIHDEMDDIDQLNALSSATHAPPGIPTKLPPPLEPPPRAPSLPAPLAPPPSVSSRPISSTNQASSSSRPDPIVRSIESQLFDLIPDFSQHQSRPPSQTAPLSHRVIPAAQASGSSIVLPSLPPPLSPSTTPRSHTPANQFSRTSVPTKPSRSLFDDDDFSDFQASPNNTSAPLMSLGSGFGSFASSTAPIESPRTHDQSIPFDDFDDFVSPPPKVPEKPSLMPLPRLIPPPTRSMPPVPLIQPVSPTQQASSPSERRSPRQAESHQRTLNLLEAAATRGVWPAPPSPLPNPIPPPTIKSTGDNLFDAFEEPRGSSAGNLTVPNTGSSLLLLSNSNPSPTPVAAPPPTSTVISENTAGASTSGNGPRLGGMRSPPPSALAMTSPLIPPHLPMKPVLPLTQPQVQHDQNMQSQLQWKKSMSAKPLSSFTQPTSVSSSFAFGQGGNLSANRSKSGTSLQQHLQQQKPESVAFSSLFNPATAPAPYPHSGSSSSQNPGSSGGRLSAQDLSFFEGL